MNKLNKQNRDRLIDGEQMTASGGGMLQGGGIQQKGKSTHGHGQQCGDCGGEEIKGTKRSWGKNIIKIFFK